MLASLRISLLLVGFFWGAMSHAQTPREAVASDVPASIAIEIGAIPLEAERQLSELSIAAERLQRDDVTANYVDTRQRLQAASDDLHQNERALSPERISARARGLFRQKWVALESEVVVWGKALDKELSSLQEKRAILKTQREAWRATLAENPGAEIPVALRERIETVMQSNVELDKLYAEQVTKLSRLHQEAQPVAQKIREVLRRFDQADARARTSLMMIDSPPIWKIFSQAEGEDGVLEAEKKSLEPQQVDVKAFLAAHRLALIIHGLVFIGFLSITLPLARRRSQWREKEFLAHAVALFSMPITMALALTLLISAIFLTTLPLRAQDLRSLLLALLCLRVLHPILQGKLRKMLYISIGLYVATKITEFSASFSVLERVELLAINLATIWFMTYVHRAIPTDEGRRRIWGLAAFVSRAILPLLVVGLIASVLGNASLAQTITVGTVYSLAAGVVLAAGVLILETTLTAILHLGKASRVSAVNRHRELLQERLFGVIRVVAVFTYLYASFGFFSIREWLTTHLWEIISYRVEIGTLSLSPLDIIAFVLSLYLATLISRFVRFILEEEVYQRVQMPRGLPNTVSMLVNYGILAIGFFVAISVAGIDLSRFAIIAGALGVGIGFGLQNVVNNFVSGLILMFERPIQVGDTIEVGVLVGHVLRIGFRSSTVRTYDGAEVIVPNGNLISAEVVNWTLSDRTRRLDIPVGVAYGSDPRKVLEVLTATAHSHQDVQPYPAPSIIFKGFGESSLDFSVRVWIKDFEDLYRVSSELSVMIYEALNTAGFEIPFPQRDLHLRSVSPGVTLSASAPASAKDPGE